MVRVFDIEIAYGLIAIFAASLENPFNDWSAEHIAQGFSWRPGSVSFRTLIDAGAHSVELTLVEHFSTPSSDAIRVIEVPFDAPADGAIEVGGVMETVPFSLAAGSYMLRCEFYLPVESVWRVRLVFSFGDKSHFRILRADSEITITDGFLTTAQPAVN